MAGSRIKGITIKINGDANGLKKALAGIDGQLRKTNGALKDVGRLLKIDPGNTELLQQKQRLLNNAIKDTKARLNELKEASKKVTPDDIGQEKYDALQREIIETEQELKNLQKEYKDFGTVAGQKLQAAGQKMQEIGGKMTEAGKTMTTKVTVPIAAVGAAVVKLTGDFDASMSKVAAVSGATGEDFDALRDKAREMGSKTKFSASEAADAMNYMAMAGWKTEDMLGGVEGIMNLAAASGEDLATTSDIVTDALTAFGMSAEDSGHFADVLAAASSNANTNVSMLGESFKYVAPVAGSLGYSAEDTSIALGLMANAGIKASQGGTALRTTLTNLANPTDDMKTAMDRLGVSLTDDEGNMLSFREVMGQLRDGFGDLKEITAEQQEAITQLDQEYADGTITEEDYISQIEELIGAADDATGATKAQVAAMLAGKTGMSGLLAIVNASDEDFEQLASAVDNSSQKFAKLKDGSIVPLNEALENGQEVVETYNGTAEEMAAVMQDNLNGQVTVLLSQLQELAISIGDILMPYIRKIVGKIQEWVDKFNSLDGRTKNIIVAIGLIAAAIGPVLAIVGTVISVIGTITSAIGVVTGAIGLLPVALGPVAIAIGAAIAVGALLYKNWDKIKETAANLAGAVKEKFTAIKDKVSESWENVKTKTTEAWNNVQAKITEKAESAKAAISSKFESMRATAASKFESIRSSAASKFENMRSTISSKVNSAKTSAANAFQAIKDNISNKITDAKNTVSSRAENIRSILSFGGLSSSVASTFGSIRDSISEKINAAKDAVSGAVDKIKGFFPLSIGRIFTGMQLPHFHVYGGVPPYGIMGKGEEPSISVEWYAKAMEKARILSGATIFGMSGSGSLLGGGEAGNEVISGEKHLLDMMANVVSAQNRVLVSGFDTTNMESMLAGITRILTRYLPQQKIAVVDMDAYTDKINRKLGMSIG